MIEYFKNNKQARHYRTKVKHLKQTLSPACRSSTLRDEPSGSDSNEQAGFDKIVPAVFGVIYHINSRPCTYMVNWEGEEVAT